MKMPYEQLEAKLSEALEKLSNAEEKLSRSEAQLVEMRAFLKAALERIKGLEERLKSNSGNSSKPPSTDQKPNKGSSGGKENRKGRGKGIARAPIPTDRVDRFMTSVLEKCPCCGSDELSELEEKLVLQQVELPEIKAIVTEFSCMKHRCKSCGEASFANLPNGVPNSSFGPRLMGLIAMLTGSLHLSKRDAMQLVKDLYGVDICEGSIINVEERVATALETPCERIHRHVMQSSLPKHFDETSWRDRAKNFYVWVGSTSHATSFYIDRRRSRDAFSLFIGTLGLAKAPVVTDRYPVYDHLDGLHQYCLAHLIRDFRKYSERDGPDGVVGHRVEKELRQICKNHRLFRKGEISKRSRDTRFRYQKERLFDYLLDGLIDGSDKLSSLCDRLTDCFERLWVFSDFTDVDPTNNLAERDLRRIVLWRKKSYGTRSDRGQRYVERITSVTQTLKKAKRNIMTYLQDAVIAYYRDHSAPTISPSLGF